MGIQYGSIEMSITTRHIGGIFNVFIERTKIRAFLACLFICSLCNIFANGNAYADEIY